MGICSLQYHTQFVTIMSSYAVIVCIIIGRATGTSDECSEAIEEFNACKDQAYEHYKTTVGKGEDGRPDWIARKSCNYLTESVEICGNKMVGACGTQEEIDEEKDDQLKVALAQIEKHISSWDSEKCPVVKAHLERLLAVEAVEASPDEEDYASKATGSAKLLQISFFSFIVVVLFKDFI